MSAPTIVFDLDGTLVDTAPDLIGTLNAIFALQGIAPVPYDEARPMIGGGARLLLERGLLKDGRVIAPGDLDGLVRDFIAHYADRIADQSRAFPGVEAALDALAARGYRFAVCTNKLEWLAVRLLDRLGLTPRFAAICGADTFGVAKPDPDFLRRTIARAGGAVPGAVMVGDSETDVATARAAKVPIIAVDFGYTERPIQSAGPEKVISHYHELADAVATLVLAAEPL